MTNPIQLSRQEGESFLGWKLRLVTEKLEREVDLDWIEIRDLLGLDCSPDHLRKTSYGAYEAKQYYEEKLKSGMSNDEIDKLEEKMVEFRKEKKKFQDQRREFFKNIDQEARFEHLKEEIVEAIRELELNKPLYIHPNYNDYDEEKEGLIVLSDWHYGMICDNTFNKYNQEIFRERVQKVVKKTIEYGKKNNIGRLNVAVLGDMVSGEIHVSTKVQSNENIIRQVQVVSETLSEIIAKFANEFKEVNVINVIGNHGRTGHKNDTSVKDNFEYLIPWYLESRLNKFNNINIVSDDDGFVLGEINKSKIVYVHGNFDRADTAAKNLPQVLGFVPNYIIGGHIHHNYEREQGVTTVIANGSLIGADDYAVQRRYYARPSQKFMVFNEDGIECTYNIKL